MIFLPSSPPNSLYTVYRISKVKYFFLLKKRKLSSRIGKTPRGLKSVIPSHDKSSIIFLSYVPSNTNWFCKLREFAMSRIIMAM